MNKFLKMKKRALQYAATVSLADYKEVKLDIIMI